MCSSDLGRAAFDRLLATADVMVVNFPLKVRERLKMRYQDVRHLNPRLIYASMTGYGESGPDAEQPGFDSTAFFARSGLLDALTYEGGPPAFSLPAQGDQMTGMNLFAAISMALLHRERTGEGSEVSTSLHASGLWSNGMLAQGALLDAYVAHRPPRTKPRSALANQYRTADGRWIQLTIVREDKMWPGICAAIEQPGLQADPRFATVEDRRRRSAELAGARILNETTVWAAFSPNEVAAVVAGRSTIFRPRRLVLAASTFSFPLCAYGTVIPVVLKNSWTRPATVSSSAGPALL